MYGTWLARWLVALAIWLALGVGGGAVAKALPYWWVATWAAAQQGSYPSGFASAQPVLKSAFPDPAEGAVDQTFRLMVKPVYGGT